MRPVSQMTESSDRALEENALRRVLWIAGGAVFATALLVTSSVVLGTVVLGGAAAYGLMSWMDNEAHRDLAAPFDATWQAAVDTLEDAGYAVDHVGLPTPTEGRIRVDDTQVVVERQPGGLTRVRVRVGRFDRSDHRRRAALILEGVANRVA